MTTNYKKNLAEQGGQEPKLKYFSVFPEVYYFVKYSDLKNFNSQKHIVIIVVVDSFHFFSRIPLVCHNV